MPQCHSCYCPVLPPPASRNQPSNNLFFAIPLTSPSMFHVIGDPRQPTTSPLAPSPTLLRWEPLPSPCPSIHQQCSFTGLCPAHRHPTLLFSSPYDRHLFLYRDNFLTMSTCLPHPCIHRVPHPLSHNPSGPPQAASSSIRQAASTSTPQHGKHSHRATQTSICQHH